MSRHHPGELTRLVEEITSLREFRKEVHETLLGLLQKEDDAIQRQIDILYLIKQDTHRELARLRKRKSRIVTGRN